MSERKIKPKKLKEYDIRKGRYPVRVSLSQWPDSEPFIDLYSGVPTDKGYRHSHFKISDTSSWQRIKHVIDTILIQKLKKGKPITAKVLETQMAYEIQQLKKDKALLEQKAKAVPKLIKEYRDIRIPEYESDLKNFEKLLKRAKREEDLQKFLTNATWLLGLEYENAKPQKIAPKQRYDFYVEKYDGYADIIEIKQSREIIFDKKGKISTNFGRALQQLIDYIDDALYYGDNNRLSKNLNFNFLKPKGILIIGRGVENQQKEKLKNLMYYFHNIEILTYDDVLERGKTIIRSLNKSKKKKHAKQEL